VRKLGTSVAVAAVVLVLAPPVHAQDSPTLISLHLEGVVDPFEASYLESNIERASDESAAAVLITIDTPGGLDSSMRDIVQAILNSNVPILCYVSPEGARAASAGAFILTACHVAAMAPGTNVGAASPVGVSGAVLQRKVMNDAAAYIRSLAERRNRNPDWAERAVRDAVSASAEEAAELDAIDFVADDVQDLLVQADGMQVEVRGGPTELQLTGATIVARRMGTATNFLHHLFTPELAFTFFYLGLILLVIEILHPGLSIPGALGLLSLVAAFTGFGMLPVQLVGVLLLVASVIFFLLELKNPGLSVAAIAGLVTLVLGGFLLFDSSVPGATVDVWVIAPIGAMVGGFFAFAIPAVLRTRRAPPQSRQERLVGQHGVATTDLMPTGTVHVAAESWSAETIGADIKKGQEVTVVASEGLRLKVEPLVDVPAGSTAHAQSQEEMK
jgi:membrane-bound serine protease (ClpP class)